MSGAGVLNWFFSHFIGISLRFIPRSLNYCMIHRSCAQHAPAAMYSTSAVDSATEFSFLECQETKHGPRNRQVLDVLFLLTL